MWEVGQMVPGLSSLKNELSIADKLFHTFMFLFMLLGAPGAV